MSILIKGMTMPKNCEKCPFGHDDSCSASIACTLLNGKRLDVLKRPKGICPLVELPPHGRLIDADALKDYFWRNNNIGFYGEFMDGSESALTDKELCNGIDNAPTIIESEG